MPTAGGEEEKTARLAARSDHLTDYHSLFLSLFSSLPPLVFFVFFVRVLFSSYRGCSSFVRFSFIFSLSHEREILDREKKKRARGEKLANRDNSEADKKVFEPTDVARKKQARTKKKNYLSQAEEEKEGVEEG